MSQSVSLPLTSNTDGKRSTFASGLGDPWGLAFQPIPELATLLLLGLGGLALLRKRRVLQKQ
jgi:MYXO-CTERM domain-containing protein